MTNSKKPIESSRLYSLYDIVKEGLIPGVFSITTAANRVKSDFIHDNILKPRITLRGKRGRMYKIKGENIIKYLKLHG